MANRDYNLTDFQRRFCSEEACLEAVFKSRWRMDLCVQSTGTTMEHAQQAPLHSMQALQEADFHHSRHPIPQDENSTGNLVLVDFFDDAGQARHIHDARCRSIGNALHNGLELDAQTSNCDVRQG